MVAKRSRAHKDALYEQLARIGKAIAAPRRIELLDLLRQAPRTVEALAEQTSMSVANTSQHLQVLRAAGLVESEKAGLYVTYRAASGDVVQFCSMLQSLAESRLDELAAVKRRFFSSKDGLETVNALDLLKRFRRGEVVILDVRPVNEFEAGHVPGAIAMPLSELERRLAELPTDREIVAYCRGPYCMFAVDAVRLLRKRGFRAARMEDGVVEWRAQGLPIESASSGGAS
jgi:rhodanese-related sulfurtransferase